jgi:hypothetical protein
MPKNKRASRQHAAVEPVDLTGPENEKMGSISDSEEPAGRTISIIGRYRNSKQNAYGRYR